jgi:hypothetical protein
VLPILNWFRACSGVWHSEDVNKYLDYMNGGEFTVVNDPGLYLHSADSFLT